MCGIAGILAKNKTGIRSEILSAMSEKLAHRGPDDHGEYLTEKIGLCHRRLSILDLSQAGRQPMRSADGRYALVFNGEIYNYQELKKEFFDGARFVSHSDTEVLLHLLIEKNISALSLLRGMFAFAFWDQETSTLLLGRDPFGKKPLYYQEAENHFLFASEIKALLNNREKAVLDAKALAKYLLYEYFPSPLTGIKNIYQVPAGSYLTIENNNIVLRQYWRPSFTPKNRENIAAPEAKLDSLLKKSVERRLIADVPVGLFLSGGLDSTAIGWYMRNARPNGPIHSFSVSFDEPSFDESLYAKKAAARLGFTHHEIKFSLDDFPQTLRELVKKMDSPLADASLLPTYQVSKLAKEYVTVVLDGDGGDELFGGYGTFAASRLADCLHWLPAPFTAFAKKTAELLPTRHNYFSFDFKLKSFLRGLGNERSRRNQIWLGAFNHQEISALLTPRHLPSKQYLFEEIDGMAPELKKLDGFDQITLLTIRHYLQNEILVKLDRATMFNGIEARTPFLDLDLAEFVFKLPASLRNNKYLLKKIMRRRISEKIINRQKKGFGVPVGQWLAGPLHDWARTVLNENKISEDGFFSPAYVLKILEEHRVNKIDHRKKIWTLLTFQLWFDHFIAQRD